MSMERSSSNSFFNCFRPDCRERKITISTNKKRTKDGSDHPTLRRFFKAVLFHTTLITKIRSKKSQYNSYASKKYKKVFSKVNLAPAESATDPPIKDIKTNVSQSMHCSSLNSSFSTTSSTASSFISTNTFNQNLEHKQEKQPSSQKMLTGKTQGLNFGLCVFIVCLIGLTCWGKFCAILCTATMFLFVPNRAKRVNFVGYEQFGSRETFLKENKKRVIMQGLLDRNRGGVCI